MTLTFDQKVLTLKSYEPLCYSVCFYLLESEQDACYAAELALIELFGDAEFWEAGLYRREEFARRAASVKALFVRGNRVAQYV